MKLFTMDSRHHAALLLFILVGTILLLLAASFLLICYFRHKYLKTKKNQKWALKSVVLTKSQATSMTGVSLVLSSPPSLLHESQAFKNSPFPVKSSLVQMKDDTASLENYIVQKNAASPPGWQCWSSSEKSPQNVYEKGNQTSILQYISSPGAFLMDSILGQSKDLEFSPFYVEDIMHCSSLKSNVDTNFVLVPEESPIPNISFINHSRSSSLPRNLGDCLISEIPGNQQYFWSSSTLKTLLQNSVQGKPNGLMDMSHHGEHMESLSVPNTLKRPPSTASTLEGKTARKSLLQLPKTGFLQPRAWFISLANGPFSNGAPIGKQDPNNITSLDSGVDVIELQVRQDGEVVRDGVELEVMQHLESYEDATGSEQNVMQLVVEEGDESGSLMGGEQSGNEQQLAHKEAAMKLNEACYRNKRSLWQKREERPLIGIN
uniref:Protein FAM171B-like isoform X2 n=1 Tax=Geotrypetes seraphini TaxID=260995 RepID=A0A6P8PT74_GEOSA|nr:protein FAM171B-like isoform X2 [Geotrypetes seraphini]XP_033791453.1 protein FAM171B-like isoform X2 [Geotrypetes seraphini]XP_033791454.1 protein FAM171B-like isoform X2 [Geotrypetes seraphini]XP_033791455.1 protein FAM171B-like isoform X2 [Geotrypetes seraphini]